MTSFRILHVVPYYRHAWAYGGIPRLATTMTRGLARRGHHVTVLTTDACDAHSRTSPDDRTDTGGVDVRVFRNVSNRLAYHWQFFTPIGLAAHLRSAAASFDIAHLHACHNLPGAIAARALTRAGVPYVVSPNGTAKPIERRIAAKRLFAATAGRRVLSGAARVLAVTEAERTQLLTLGVKDSMIAVVPNPVEDGAMSATIDRAEVRRAFGLDDAPVVLFLGKLTPRKGVAGLIRAFAMLEHRGARLVIAGNDMGSGASLQALAAQLGLGSRVLWAGLLEGPRRFDALAAADVLVYPSRDEIFGLVPVEALLCGTPVAVCGDSGCGEIVGALGGGLVVPYGDQRALARAIETIVAAPAEWRERARAAADRARVRFGSRPVCERLERVYADVIGGNRSARKLA